jgi:hypothetical protein
VGLLELAAALAMLGDDASRASQVSRDVRLHVVACQAEHLSGDVRVLLGFEDPSAVSLDGSVGMRAAAVAARLALESTAAPSLAPSLRASIEWLLRLAEASTP